MENNNQSNSENNQKIPLLKKKVSRLRAFVYLLLACLIFLTSVILLWIYNIYTETSFETYFSIPPKQTKAYLYLSPREGNYKIGDEFPVDVLVNTVGSNIVVVSAHLSYNKNYLEALSIDLSDSLFEFTAENEINKEEGKIKITLGKPTPGIRSYNGKVARIYFRAKNKTHPYMENIYFDFTKGSDLYSTVILDDKKGTNILSNTRGAKIKID